MYRAISPDFLGDDIDGISRLIVSPVEQVLVGTFLELGPGDILFIDTSHTVKTGGDVVFLLGEALPRLAKGVVVHFTKSSSLGITLKSGYWSVARGTSSTR